MRKFFIFALLVLFCGAPSIGRAFVIECFEKDRSVCVESAVGRFFSNEDYPAWVQAGLISYDQWASSEGRENNPLLKKIAVGELNYRTIDGWPDIVGGYYWYLVTSSDGNLVLYVRAEPDFGEQLEKYCGQPVLEDLFVVDNSYVFWTEVNLSQELFWNWQYGDNYFMEATKLLDMVRAQAPFIVSMKITRLFPFPAK